MSTAFTLPELGENVDKGDVVRVLVAPGDAVKKDQPVLELETDKATIEVPSGVAGTVGAVHVKAGDTVTVGQAVFEVEAGEAAAEAEAPAKESPPKAASTRAPVVDISAGRPPAQGRDIASEAPPVEIQRPPKPESPAAMTAPAPAAEAAAVPAAPSVRRFAREVGVDITEVTGSGPGGRIGPDDVKAHVKARMAGGAVGPSAAPELPDFSRWGEIDVQPMNNIRRKTAEHLSVAWAAPHVTQHDRADVTELEAFRQAQAGRVEKAGGKLTVTAILIRLVAEAIRRFPAFASSVDMARQSIVVKQYCHIGVAVDTPRGLLVPVIRDADRKTLTDIAVELTALSQKARDGKLTLDEMAGGVFTITNLGGIGGTSFTPIINQPEVAILGVSRGALEPVWRDDAFVPRRILPLSLSYDHRVIDGADAARFLRVVAEALEQPLTLYL
jgi:pyruvate dehydrogenase E2 component (dihydrolipoamide acetyltransferase)